MKSNKKTVLFLVVAVVGIWGTIAYKLIDKGSSGDIIIQTGNIENNTPESDTNEYTLLLNYGDPFFPSKKKVKGTVTTINKKVKKQKPVIKWPAIKYNGCLSANENIRGHFTYNGKSMILKPGDSIGNHSVLKEIYNDSVLITYNHEQKWFFR